MNQPEVYMSSQAGGRRNDERWRLTSIGVDVDDLPADGLQQLRTEPLVLAELGAQQGHLHTAARS